MKKGGFILVMATGVLSTIAAYLTGRADGADAVYDELSKIMEDSIKENAEKIIDETKTEE